MSSISATSNAWTIGRATSQKRRNEAAASDRLLLTYCI
jgi:hypothetical protein